MKERGGADGKGPIVCPQPCKPGASADLGYRYVTLVCFSWSLSFGHSIKCAITNSLSSEYKSLDWYQWRGSKGAKGAAALSLIRQEGRRPSLFCELDHFKHVRLLTFDLLPTRLIDKVAIMRDFKFLTVFSRRSRGGGRSNPLATGLLDSLYKGGRV